MKYSVITLLYSHLLVVFFVPLFISLSYGEEANGDWEKVKESEGVQIYLSEVPGSKFRAFRGIVILETSVETILAVFRDIPSHTKLLFRCTHSSLLQEMNPSEYITYTVLDAPWPVADRDSVNYISVFHDLENLEVTITMREHLGSLSEQHLGVRVTKFEGFWRLKKVDVGNVEVTLQLHVDPGGWLPSWIINRAVEVFPYKTLCNLRKMVKLPKYLNVQSSFYGDTVE
ncbi:MAG: hypothetical protein D8M57_11020 [Candidatus Scalindua sp. AMX11]|nr:MAG: hypothetical protein DWQ00_16035 [Candidatus Scalindua sp.]NOG83712.1 hypothetical protein [Planctomycetota bacterium]RZV73839.1 MAG: hypothetical protein EX341_13355 [Candidatus Scalindua sp. SCAELEC01]TDE64847.1 MAG: hypothetical protein D8M57_11020 [Candidatus Scalindua sp. AMX11]GJQ60666.1 MAG: cyclase [Candidatus Scalindua sp.]